MPNPLTLNSLYSRAAGTRLESILLDISLLPGGSGIFNSTGYILQNVSLTNSSLEQAIAIPSTNLSLFASALPLESGHVVLQHSFMAGNLTSGQFQTSAYTFSINVTGTEVPEPSTLAGLACLGLGSLLLKKKTATLS